MSARPPHEPYREVPAGTFRWRLGVRPLDLADWLVITDHYSHEVADPDCASRHRTPSGAEQKSIDIKAFAASTTVGRISARR